MKNAVIHIQSGSGYSARMKGWPTCNKALVSRSDTSVRLRPRFGGALPCGFTMIEMMATLAVVAILLTVAAPSLRTFVEENRLATATNDFVGHISTARTEALKRRSNAIVCKSGGGTTCSATGTWNSGWISFADIDNSGGWTAGDLLLRTSQGVDSNSVAITTAVNSIVFNRNGETSASSAHTFCSSVIGKSKVVTLNEVGRHTLSSGNC